PTRSRSGCGTRADRPSPRVRTRAGYNRRTVPAMTRPTSPGLRRLRRVRVAGGVAVSALLLGSAVLAPFSVDTALADESSVAAQLQRHQGFTAAAADSPALDSEIPVAEDATAAPGVAQPPAAA